jgi:transcriptional repressor NrdR
VLPKLRALDQVAYVRFASIYRDFSDLEGFAKELDALRGEPVQRTGDEDTGRHVDAPGETTDEHPAVAVSE